MRDRVKRYVRARSKGVHVMDQMADSPSKVNNLPDEPTLNSTGSSHAMIKPEPTKTPTKNRVQRKVHVQSTEEDL